MTAVVEAQHQNRADENDEIYFKDGDSDICQQLMDRYAKSSASQHRHLVATAAAMRSILTSESLPPSPPAYFAAAISSLDSSTAADPMAVSALLTFLSIVVPLVPRGGISAPMAREAVSVLVRPIDGEGEGLGVASLRAGVKCIGTLLVGFCDLDYWESIRIGFGSLLRFSVDKRPKVRRCAQECLEKLFGSLRLSSTVIKEASDTLYALLKEHKPVLSELSSRKVVEGSKVESSLKSENAEAAHVLNVLSATVPFLSAEVSSCVFSELCELMGSHFSPLTRRPFIYSRKGYHFKACRHDEKCNWRFNNALGLQWLPWGQKHIVGASLEYYVDHIVPLAKSLILASKEAKKSGHGKTLRTCGHELLKLLPAFCNYPIDVPQKFGSLVKLMVKFIKKKSFMHEAVAVSLQMLVNQNKRMPKPSTDVVDEENTNMSEDAKPEVDSRFHYSKKASMKNMKTLASSSAELLQTLVHVLTASGAQISADFKAAIGCLASTLDSSVKKKILISLLNKFDPAGESEIEGQGNQSNDSIDEEKDNRSATKTQLKRSAVLDLASSFVEGAKEDLIELIYNLVRQSFQATDEADLRGAYNTLSRILEEHGWFCSSHFAEVIEMLLSHKTPEDEASSKSRFACFHVLMARGIQSSSEEENEKAFLILNEMILTLKDWKEEHRKAACDALVMVYTTLKNSSSMNSDELCPKLINMISGYISGTSPHIRSGAVSALSVLIYRDPEICLSSPELLSSVLELLHTKSIEIIKAVLGFVKVLVSTSQAQDLQSLLQNLLYEILPWSSVSRHYFKSKVTIIVEIMIRKCGTRAVQLATPDKHKSFLQTVLENRSSKAKEKDETNDSQTTSIDSSREPRKRNHHSSETTAKQDGGKEHNKFKRHKSTHHSDTNGSRTGPKRPGNRSFGKHWDASGNNLKSVLQFSDNQKTKHMFIH
ncbi:ARM repeat superfamily protein [Raphanus sativus]|nr:ARM repeat superfamily protein [Raphanus sativus]